MSPLSPLARLLLWDYERGSLAYDLVSIGLLLLVLASPAGFWADPLQVRP